MSNKQMATQGGSGLLPSGAVSLGQVINVDDDIPQGYKPSITYINARGHRVDPFGRRVSGEGYAQDAGVSGSKEQKESTLYNVPLEDNENAEVNDNVDNDEDVDDNETGDEQ